MNSVDSIIEKIKKAVRLANKTTSEGERDTALRLARNLAEKNGIAFEDIKVSETAADKATIEADETYRTVQGSEFGYTCFILKEHFAVIVMLTPMRGKTYMARLTWFGSKVNIDIAKYVYKILMRESAKAWEAVRKEKIPGLKKQSFLKGFFWQISEKLRANPIRNDLAEDTKLAEAKLLEYRQEHSVRESTQRKLKLDYTSLMTGIEAGKKINLHRPCDGKETITPLLKAAV